MVPIQLNDVKEGLYLIDENGNIWSNYKHDYMIPTQDKDGYLKISLSGKPNKDKVYYRIHTLVALTFIGQPPKDLLDPTINHIDNNLLNNNYHNLEWVERSINSSIRQNKGKGELNHEAKLTELQVKEICEILINTNRSYASICEEYHIQKSTISQIRNHKTWKNITNNYNFDCRQKIRDEHGRFQEININCL